MHDDIAAKCALLFLGITTVIWVFFSDRLFAGVLALMGFSVFGIMTFNCANPLFGSLLMLAGVLSFILTLLEIRAKRG